MDINKITISEWIKIASVFILFGALYTKIDAMSDNFKVAALEAKEYRVRIEKLELSIAEMKLEITTLQYTEDVKRREYDDRQRRNIAN